MTGNIYERMTLEELEFEQEHIRAARAAYQSRTKKLAVQSAAISEAMKSARSAKDDVIVTDHAIVRWLERADGMDLDPVRQAIREMVAGRVSPTTEQDVVIGDRAVAVVRRDLVVTTILSLEQVLPEPGQLKRPRGDTDG